MSSSRMPHRMVLFVPGVAGISNSVRHSAAMNLLCTPQYALLLCYAFINDLALSVKTIARALFARIFLEAAYISTSPRFSVVSLVAALARSYSNRMAMAVERHDAERPTSGIGIRATHMLFQTIAKHIVIACTLAAMGRRISGIIDKYPCGPCSSKSDGR